MNNLFLKSTAGDETVEVEGVFAAPIARVYRAWTDPAEMMQWFGPSPGSLLAVICDPRVGGKICLEHKTEEHFRNIIEGQYLTVEPNRKLVFSWSHIITRLDGTKDASPVSKVTVVFEEVGAQTRVHLSHSDIVRQAGRDGVSQGWNGAFIQFRALVGEWNAKAR